MNTHFFKRIFLFLAVLAVANLHTTHASSVSGKLDSTASIASQQAVTTGDTDQSSKTTSSGSKSSSSGKVNKTESQNVIYSNLEQTNFSTNTENPDRNSPEIIVEGTQDNVGVEEGSVSSTTDQIVESVKDDQNSQTAAAVNSLDWLNTNNLLWILLIILILLGVFFIYSYFKRDRRAY